MSDHHPLLADSNPFCTNRIRPGAMPYLFPEGVSAELLVQRFQESQFRGEIIGPHGSGKSSLVAALLPVFEKIGRPPLLIELHDGQSRLPIDLSRDARLSPASVIIVDGYEQLNRWNRQRLSRFCKNHELGLLVTAHQSIGLPLLFQTKPSLALAAKIVQQLLANQKSPFETGVISQCFLHHNGNLREMLFDLYDHYQQ